MMKKLEDFLFAARGIILLVLFIITGIALYFALQLKLDTSFDKALPAGHEYIETFQQYRKDIFGANSVVVVLEAKNGTIWNQPFFATYKKVSDDIFFLPGVSRPTVTSLWTPNVRYIEVTEEGATAEDVIPSFVQPDGMTDQDIDDIQSKVIRGGFVGRLVENDFGGALIWADLQDYDPSTGKKLDYFDLAKKLETQIRDKYESENYTVRIIGFAKAVGDIADGARGAVMFFAIAFALTALALYLYSHSVMLSAMVLLASLTSVIWQFGLLYLLGFGLDPLGILVPFLVFAIGVSHGVQQINRITASISLGASSELAARESFSALLGPGAMALTTALVGFATLYLIPIPLIQDIAVAASIGVALKMITTLVMLPLLVSYLRFDAGFALRAAKSRESRLKFVEVLSLVSMPRNATIVLLIGTFLFGIGVVQNGKRHVGSLQAGTAELQPESRYNVDSRDIAAKFSIGLNILTVVAETPADACIDYTTLKFLGGFSWAMMNVPGVTKVTSLPFTMRTLNVPFNEGNLRWKTIPKARESLVQEQAVLPPGALTNGPCTMFPLHLYLADGKATTINRVTAAVKDWRAHNKMDEVSLRLAAGNMGVQAAVNEEISQAELPMMLWVYGVVIALVLINYRDWRAVIACCLPLTLATFLGYWFMAEMQIGLTVATLSVMVLAVGIGVDYAFYMYNHIIHHMASGRPMTECIRVTMIETGMATIFTAITLAVGVSSWAFSALKFQADMGLLLGFMFMINMIAAITVLPSIAVMLDVLFPRKEA
ncbi:MAG: MMPL family transporter [Rhizobiales bacterium]|nr:MMPL family transporter [Hyphomicrobiales bacterium]